MDDGAIWWHLYGSPCAARSHLPVAGRSVNWGWRPPHRRSTGGILNRAQAKSAWRDPALVRYGRAGQRQHGVDIIARNGGLYPIGLQCKKRAQWPVTRLTTAQVDAEVAKALSFKPALKAFYILTTAPDDANLLRGTPRMRGIHERA